MLIFSVISANFILNCILYELEIKTSYVMNGIRSFVTDYLF